MPMLCMFYHMIFFNVSYVNERTELKMDEMYYLLDRIPYSNIEKAAKTLPGKVVSLDSCVTYVAGKVEKAARYYEHLQDEQTAPVIPAMKDLEALHLDEATFGKVLPVVWAAFRQGYYAGYLEEK